MQPQHEIVESGRLYVLPTQHQRVFPPHGYTMGMLARKRFYENTSFLFINARFTLPVLVQINQELENVVSQGIDFTMEDFVNVAKGSLTTHTISLIDWMARIGLQTGIACALIASEKAYADSAVYLWDLYPRLHRYYIGKVTNFLKIPRFVVSLLGPCPASAEIAFMKDKSTLPMCVFEDCLKRNGIILISDILVDAARLMLHVCQMNKTTTTTTTTAETQKETKESALKSGVKTTNKSELAHERHRQTSSETNNNTKNKSSQNELVPQTSKLSTFFTLWGHSVLRRCNSTGCAALGAALGRAVWNDDGEYWGEIVGLGMSSTVFVLIACNMSRLRHAAQKSIRVTRRTPKAESVRESHQTKTHTQLQPQNTISAGSNVDSLNPEELLEQQHLLHRRHRRHSHHRSGSNSSAHSRGSRHGSREGTRVSHNDGERDGAALDKATTTNNSNISHGKKHDNISRSNTGASANSSTTSSSQGISVSHADSTLKVAS